MCFIDTKVEYDIIESIFMDGDCMNKDVTYLRLINLFNGFVFYAPIALLLRTSKGITIVQFFILQIILYLTTCIMEIPCGWITDRIRYKKTIVLSTCLMVLARIQFIYAHTFYIFALEAVLEGIAISFMSGTMNAYIYQRLGEHGFEKNISSIDNFGTIGFILSTILFFPLYKIGGMQVLIILTVMATILAFIMTFFLQDTYEESETNSIDRRVFKKSSFWKMSLYASVFSLGMIVINFFYVVKLNTLGVDEVYMSGIILLYSFVQLVVPRILDRLNRNQTEKNVKIFMGLGGLSFLILYFSNNIIVVIVLMAIVSTIILVPYYIFSRLQNNYIDQLNLRSNRATILSIFNMGNNIVSIVSFAFLGMNVSDTGLNIFLMIGIIYIVIALLYKNVCVDNES